MKSSPGKEEMRSDHVDDILNQAMPSAKQPQSSLDALTTLLNWIDAHQPAAKHQHNFKSILKQDTLIDHEVGLYCAAKLLSFEYFTQLFILAQNHLKQDKSLKYYKLLQVLMFHSPQMVVKKIIRHNILFQDNSNASFTKPDSMIDENCGNDDYNGIIPNKITLVCLKLMKEYVLHQKKLIELKKKESSKNMVANIKSENEYNSFIHIWIQLQIFNQI